MGFNLLYFIVIVNVFVASPDLTVHDYTFPCLPLGLQTLLYKSSSTLQSSPLGHAFSYVESSNSTYTFPSFITLSISVILMA